MSRIPPDEPEPKRTFNFCVFEGIMRRLSQIQLVAPVFKPVPEYKFQLSSFAIGGFWVEIKFELLLFFFIEK